MKVASITATAITQIMAPVGAASTASAWFWFVRVPAALLIYRTRIGPAGSLSGLGRSGPTRAALHLRTMFRWDLRRGNIAGSPYALECRFIILPDRLT
jgi:hypothetical protein